MKCPYCEFMAENVIQEIDHMNQAHTDVIMQRHREAGIMVEDLRTGPDLPSYLTLKELQTVMIFATKFAVEQEGFANEGVIIGLHIRDRGNESPMPASWIEFEVGPRKFALWRNTLDLYEVGPDGAVSEEPLHRND